MNEYDITLKLLTDKFPSDFISLALGEVMKGEVVKLDKKLPLSVKEADFLAKVEKGGKEFIVHIEFQSSFDPEMPERMFFYTSRCLEKYRLHVYPVVLFLDDKDKDKGFKSQYGYLLEGLDVLRYNFKVMKIWEIDAELVIDQSLYGLLPLVPLMRYKRDVEEVIKEDIKKIEEIDDPELKADIYFSTAILAGIKYSREFISRLFEEEIMRQSVVYHDILEKGIKEGMEKGMEKGKIDAILSILSARFGKVPESLIKKIEEVKDIKRLDQLLLEAVKVRGMEEFERIL